ncbi:GNAT family N-acetyltransferase [Corynebacterium liangguodongii]|uniref:GNAT family N-acetyltransferase n=1 Tax=Corynebacterium liangguodongii TaxID=2079535 RepID=A0A2S0WG43_9CORY|nr:GNAT family N-acetyltransferase [Corynebacterium liangguodongii]AWB84694.1 GNAT family N-acetyltransferase [Corynebacterium liangguodongii]PWB99702.1 N-acetyltransferase [Corynebacterium liangguodongii]
MFRSDDIAIGDRVVVRQRVGSHASDVIGHVVSLEPLVIRPQEVGGFPSFKDAMEIGEYHVIKKLSPRTVRNSDIRAVEVAYAKAFPGREQQLIDAWLARAGAEIAERSNSATPIGHSAGFDPVPLERITEFYHQRGMPVQLLIPERIGKPALRILSDDWVLGEEIIVMTRPLSPGHLAEGFEVLSQPDRDWLALYHFRGEPLPPEAIRPIDGRMGFARLTRGGETVAVTRVTLTQSDDGRVWLGYSAVEVRQDMRRQGLGTALGASVAAWGAAQGAHNAYLHVRADNTAALGLYAKLGFIEHHRHRYARLG